jgi:hypothetical protein
MPLNLYELPTALRSLIKGFVWGTVWPPRLSPLPLPEDGRTIALRTLAQYIAALNCYRVGTAGEPSTVQFNIPEDRFYIEWPDAKESMVFPCIAVVHDTGKYDVIGLVSYVEEDSFNEFSPGTVVQWQGEYVETIQLEIWCNYKAERRAILSALETAMSPTEQMSGVRFKMPTYYNQLVCFTLNSRKIIDEPDSAKGRRRATMEIQMRFNVVALVNATTMNPVFTNNVDSAQDGTPVNLTTDPNAQFPQGR